MANYTTMSLDAIKLLCSVINKTVDLPNTIISDTSIATNTTHSSYKIKLDMDNLETELKNYMDTAIAGMNKLTKEIINDKALVVKDNVLYLYKADDDLSNNYMQMMLINGVAIELGSTQADFSNIYNKTEIDDKFAVKLDLDTLTNSFNDLKSDFDTHIGDTSIHITQDEKDKLVTTDDLDMSKLVTTDDIVTTIDSSSTNDKIPSAKTINTELDKINNNLGEKADVNKVAKKIYIKDVSSEDARTLIQNHWNEFDRFEFYNLRIDTAKWAWNAEIYAHTQEYGTVLLMSYGSDVPRVFYGRLYNGVWTWKELATVDNAKNVGVTTITPVNSAITGTIEYTVKNGICYVSMRNLMSTISSTSLLISTTMPKPSINCSDSSVNASGNIAMIYIDKGTTNLYGNFYTKNAKSDCSFSYPVA